MEEQLVDGALRTHTTFINSICCLIWVQFVVPQNNYNSNIKDRWSKITKRNIIIMKKVWNIVRITKMWQRHEVSKCCWKNGANKLAGSTIATNLQLVLKKKMQWLWRAIKQNRIKQGMPVSKMCSFHKTPRRQQTWVAMKKLNI